MCRDEDPREPEVPQFERIEGQGGTPSMGPMELTSRLCAYNQSRERFISAGVEIAGFSSASIDVRLPDLTPGSGRALWIIPSRNISPVSVRVPLDLVYLDQNCVVVDTVESFPISPASQCSSLAASSLVLPADSIVSGCIRSGDCLIVCPPKEMKQRLEAVVHAASDSQDSQMLNSGPSIAVKSAEPEDKKSEDTTRANDWVQSNVPMPPNPPGMEAVRATEPDAPVPEPAFLMEHPQFSQGEGKAKKSWWRRIFWGDPPEPRRASRESLSWLVAYFFTGGIPIAQTVRDVSLTGLYVLTEERWYLGTIIRMTLTDRRDPSVERSITLNAKVVRWGNDGVGLEFVLQDNKTVDSCMAGTADERFVKVNKVQIEQFLRRLRAGTR